jgi:organic hydroperoxide reductase OsmC/OhrA
LHRYKLNVIWTGAVPGRDRSYRIVAAGKPDIAGSADPAFRGDPACWNPEELLLASLAACHKLWYLGLCAQAGVVVTGYEDAAEGEMLEEAVGGAGHFTGVVLRPRVTLAAGCDVLAAEALHERAHEMCFIARSVNFPVVCRAVVVGAAA